MKRLSAMFLSMFLLLGIGLLSTGCDKNLPQTSSSESETEVESNSSSESETVGESPRTPVEYKSQHIALGYWDDKDYPHVTICRTVEELNAHFPSLNTGTVYDETFFDVNTLIFVELATAHSAQSFSLVAVETDGDGILHVSIKENELPSDTEGAAVMGSDGFLITLARQNYIGTTVVVHIGTSIFMRS